MFLQAQHKNFSVLQDMGIHTVFLTSLCIFHVTSKEGLLTVIFQPLKTECHRMPTNNTEANVNSLFCWHLRNQAPSCSPPTFHGLLGMTMFSLKLWNRLNPFFRNLFIGFIREKKKKIIPYLGSTDGKSPEESFPHISVAARIGWSLARILNVPVYCDLHGTILICAAEPPACAAASCRLTCWSSFGMEQVTLAAATPELQPRSCFLLGLSASASLCPGHRTLEINALGEKHPSEAEEEKGYPPGNMKGN
ncbi:hypothetical protein EK904_012709 [Melospiza melodia maxima]|nr:hypothetical protein EK904_012709 [Melospiza melodia maxima]